MAEPPSEVEEEAEEGDAPPPPEKRFRFADVMVEVADGDVANATVLSLPDRGYTEVESLESLKCMKRLELRGNHLQRLDFVEMNHELCWLGLARNRLRKLSFLGNLYNLAVLDVSDNRISRMQGLEGLTSLKAFIAARNRISRLEGLLPKRHKELETLVLAGNRISEVKLSGFGKLKKASLSQNGLHAFPVLEGLPQLAELRLNGNKLTSLPGAVLGKLPSLHTLDLGNNLLNSQEQLSPLSGLRKLKNLNLQGNAAEPAEGLLRSLAGLEILNNRRLVAKEKGRKKGAAAAKPREEKVSVHGRAFQGQKTVLDDDDEEDGDAAAAGQKESPKKAGKKERAAGASAGKGKKEASWNNSASWNWNEASWKDSSWQGSSWSGSASWNEAPSWKREAPSWRKEGAAGKKKAEAAAATPAKKKGKKATAAAEPAKKGKKAEADSKEPAKKKKRKAAAAEAGAEPKRRRKAAGKEAPAGAEPAKKKRKVAKK